MRTAARLAAMITAAGFVGAALVLWSAASPWWWLGATGALVLAGAAWSGARGSAAALGAALGAMLVAGGVRLSTVRAPPGWSICEAERCSSQGPWWSRLVPERLATQVAFVAARAVGVLDAAEARSYARAFDAELARVPGEAAGLFSTAGTLRRIVVEPPGDDLLPAVIFLHGAGGLSSAYVSVLQRSLGRVLLIAPALDLQARWDSEVGQALVAQTLKTLPPRVDRRRLVLLGLSNGAFFGARYAPFFSSVVLVSGLGDPGTFAGQLRVISGAEDRRVPARHLEEMARSLGRGLHVQVIPGADHALILTHPEAWAGPVREVLTR